MFFGKAKGPNAGAETLKELTARWWEHAGIGYQRDRKNSVGWAEYLERLAAEEESKQKDGDR
jgi:hypothetical protein